MDRIPDNSADTSARRIDEIVYVDEEERVVPRALTIPRGELPININLGEKKYILRLTESGGLLLNKRD